jgi:hypothetical protein
MEFLKSRTIAVDASVRAYQEVRDEYLNSDDEWTSEAAEAIQQRLRAAALELVDSAQRLVIKLDGDV